MIYEVLLKLKSNKKEIILVVVLLILVFALKIRLFGVTPFREIIFIQNGVDAQNGDFSKGPPHFIRHFGIKILIKLSGLIFGKISWLNFTILSHMIAILGLTATYLISKRINKESTLGILTLTLILSSSLVLFFLGSEEFSGFAISFLMIAYYLMLERKPLSALIAFMAAAFSRTEIFLLFPFFIAQYWYINNINFNITKELKEIKTLPPQKIVLNTLLIIVLCVEAWFLVTNLVSFYSGTSNLELFGPQPKEDKAIFSYLYHHLTYNLSSRIYSNILVLITRSFFQHISKLSSIIIFTLFIISSFLGIKDKRIQIFLFNIFFFFVLYVIIRYDGFINGYFRYDIFIIYPLAIIVPYMFTKTLFSKTRKIFLKENKILLIIIILIFVFVLSISLLNLPERFILTSQLNNVDHNIITFYRNLSENCRFIFLTNLQQLLFIRIPERSEILSLQLSEEEFEVKLSNEIKENQCVYFVIPRLNDIFYLREQNENPNQKILDLPSKIEALVKSLNQKGFKKIYNFTTDNFCKDYLWCEEKNKQMNLLSNVINITQLLTQINQTGMKSELSGIYYWENQTVQK